MAQTPPTFTKAMLKQEYAGMCQHPEKAFPSPPPAEKMARFKRWCGCVNAAIDEIPDNKLQQATAETFEEYAKYRADPAGFVPSKPFSMIRLSKVCVAQSSETND